MITYDQSRRLRGKREGDLVARHASVAPTGAGNMVLPTVRAPERLSSAAVDAARKQRVIDWGDREAFLHTVAAEQPDSVSIDRYRGGWSQRLSGTEGIEHPTLRGLETAQAEAAQRDGELSRFIAVFRSGDAVHRSQVQADWVEELEGRLDDWRRRVKAVREDQAGFPHIQQWGEQLHRALVGDDQFMAAETPSAQDNRGRDLARSMFGPDCPVESHYILRALGSARTERADILLERQRAQWQIAVPDWAPQLRNAPHSPATFCTRTAPWPTPRSSSACSALRLPNFFAEAAKHRPGWHRRRDPTTTSSVLPTRLTAG